MKAYEFYEAWKQMESQAKQKLTPEQVRESLLQGFPVKFWTLDDIRYNEKVMSYVGKFKSNGERYAQVLLSNDLGRFLLEHLDKRFLQIGLYMKDDRATDCVVIYVR